MSFLDREEERLLKDRAILFERQSKVRYWSTAWNAYAGSIRLNTRNLNIIRDDQRKARHEMARGVNNTRRYPIYWDGHIL